MDTILIRELRVRATLGVEEWERSAPREIRVDLEFAADVGRASASDDLADAIDYEAVSSRLREFLAASEFRLLETLAARAAELLRREFRLPWLRLTVRKPQALEDAETVAVVIERGERPASA
jgi:dihydroneopterin aldolase